MNEPIATAERLPPHSIEAEQGLLGSCLIAPDEWIDRIAVTMPAEGFYFPAHQALFETMSHLRQAGQPVEFMSIVQALRDRSQLEAVGGPAAVSRISTAVPTAANAGHYLMIVSDRWRLRRIIKEATELASRAYDPGASSEELDGLLVAMATDRTAHGSSGRSVRGMKELMLGAMERLEARFARRGSIAGITSGFPMLDRLTDGWKAGQMIVVGAKEKQGKSALVRQFALAANSTGNRPFLVSLEMSAEEIADALLATVSKIDVHSLTMNPDGWSAKVFDDISAAATKLANAEIRVLDEGEVTLAQVGAAVRHDCLRNDCKIAFVDYLQLLKSGTKTERREQEVSEVGRGIKMLAKDLGIPIIVPVQLNEDGDVRESKAIQMHCDKWLSVQHEDWENSTSGGKAWFRMKNQRGGGGRGAIPVLWRPEITTFLPRDLRDGDACEPPVDTPKKSQKSNNRHK